MVTAIATAMVVALLAWGLGPAPVERPGAGIASGGLPPLAGSGTDVTGAVTAGDAGNSIPASGPASTGSTIAAPRAVAQHGGPEPGNAPVGPAGNPTPAGGDAPPTTASPGQLTATDRGVTADAIKVGFTILDFAGANEYGFSPNLREDASRAIDAFVDHANKRGGVLGRRIQPFKVTIDLLRPDQQRQRCVELTETHGVFGVLDSFAFASETSTACIAAEQKTLLLNGITGSSENIRQGFPYHVSMKKDDNRKMKDLAAGAKSSGFFDPDRGFKKLGVFNDSCSSSAAVFDSPTNGLKAYLRSAGIAEWSEYRGGCDVTEAQRAGAQAVLQFKGEGVTHVLLAARPPLVEGYLNAAARSDYYPKYFAGDYVNLVVGGLTDKYEPRGFDGAMGVTTTHAGEGAIGKPLPPLTQTCSQILTDHGLAPISAAPPRDIGDDIEVLELCENFLLFLQVATAAGPNLTRSTWVNALGGIGDFRGATVDLARFDRPGKQTGGDTMKLITWHRSCTCWKELTDFEPAAG